MRSTFTLLTVFFVFAAFASAETWSGVPIRDATIYEEAEVASGGGLLVVGHTRGKVANGVASTFRRSLLAFDLSAIPAGATIDSAELTLTVSRRGGGSSTASFDLTAQRLTASWGEGLFDGRGQGTDAEAGDVTYNTRFFGGEAWATSGGDFLDPISASALITGAVRPQSTVVLSGSALTADVQAWVDTPASNHGWILRGAETSQLAGATIHFFAREDTLPAGVQPTLTLTYSMAEATWNGYPIVTQDGWVNTGDWIGWVNVSDESGWVFSLSLDKFIYVPEGSGWVFIPR